MPENNLQHPVAKTAKVDVEGGSQIRAQNAYNAETAPPLDHNQDKKKKLGKIPIILAVILVVGVAVGTYFIVVSEDSESDKNDMRKTSHQSKSPDAVLSKEETQISTDITSALITTDDEGNNGSVFKTDPICRDLAKSSVFVFDCYHQRTFNDLSDNSTVKCVYLNSVGSCMQSLLEEEYGIDCDLLDQLYLLNLNADMILERSNFNVKTECTGWYDYYKKTVEGVKE
ncbi:uncharacterized protein LOC117339408 [Pecten maximus]|uniref:uncharacterized protein LOC117339408 n=1 Tax=Pecten maximus TaxID=6579 RepID=UPI001458077D|nr:uncharacterized protein LOC117339408 [Pecten maximus]